MTMHMDEELKRLGFVAPTIEKRLFSIRHWSKNNIANDYIYSISNSIDNIEAAPGTTIYVTARYAGSFILEEGGQLIAPNLIKCNSIILSHGAKAYCPSLQRTENGWFGENDYKRDGTIFVDKGSLIYAPYCQPKYQTGEGEFLRKLPDSELAFNH